VVIGQRRARRGQNSSRSRGAVSAVSTSATASRVTRSASRSRVMDPAHLATGKDEFGDFLKKVAKAYRRR